MLSFIKHKKVSSRRHINIKQIKDNILVLPENKYRIILKTSSVNFGLKSDAEQDIVLDSFQTFLHTLSFPIQILIHVGEVDPNRYLTRLQNIKTNEHDRHYTSLLQEHEAFLETLVSGNTIMTRTFYLVIPYQKNPSENFSFIKQRLELQRDIVIKGLHNLGIKSNQLTNVELLEVFYRMYNPQKSKNPVLKKYTHVLFEKYFYV